VCVCNIAKNDGIRRTDLRARRRNFTIPNRSLLFLSLNLSGSNALYAVSALFHHAAAANCHLRIPGKLETGCLGVGVLEKIESPHLIGQLFEQ
jgi:hypothetical protein